MTIRGQDRDVAAIRSAQDNAARAGVERWARFAVVPLADAAPLVDRSPDRPGLLCTNPPYGVRLEDQQGARLVHRELGAVLRERFQGWNAAVLTGAPELGKELGLRAYRTHTVWNGAIECRLLRIQVQAGSAREVGSLGKGTAHLKDTPGARMFANRLAKNLKRLRSWAQREDVTCYRLYDADMPEYAFAIDLYRTIEPDAAVALRAGIRSAGGDRAGGGARRRGEVLASLPEVTGVPEERIQVRTRRRTQARRAVREASTSRRTSTRSSRGD